MHMSYCITSLNDVPAEAERQLLSTDFKGQADALLSQLIYDRRKFVRLRDYSLVCDEFKSFLHLHIDESRTFPACKRRVTVWLWPHQWPSTTLSASAY